MAVNNAINLKSAGVAGVVGDGSYIANAVTNHSVLLGGSTNATITSLTNGTTGQVLTANTGADPSWGAVTGTISPSTNFILYDDFIGSVLGSTTGYDNFMLPWKNRVSGSSGVSTTSLTTTAGRPGVFQNVSLSIGDNSGIMMQSLSDDTSGCMVLGGGSITLNWVVNVVTLSTVTNRFILRCGLGDTFNADQANGVYFEYSDNENSGKWIGKTASASTRSSANSNNTVSAGAWVNLQITINSAASSVSFYVNGTEITNSPLSTNIPTAQITPFFDVQRTAGSISAGQVLVDYFYLNQTFSSTR